MGPILVILILLALLVIWYVGTLNGLRKKVVKIEEAASGIDVALTKRYDTLTKLVDVVRAYAQHEQETLSMVIQMRSGMSVDEKSEANRQMDVLSDRIRVIAEAYPELKSSENYRQLQASIVDVEEHLQAARRAYNGNVSLLNQRIVSFPASIVANLSHIEKQDFFKAEDAKREDVKIDL